MGGGHDHEMTATGAHRKRLLDRPGDQLRRCSSLR